MQLPGLTENSLQPRRFLAPEYVFGNGARLRAGEGLCGLGAKRALVVTMADLREYPWFKDCVASLHAAGVDHVVYDSVSQNPRDKEVMAGVEVYRSQGCDSILALGGGSPMDCAKAIGAAAHNNRHVLEFEGVERIESPGPPLVCVPTTAGSSADVSQFAIITDTERWVKIAILAKCMVPHLALVDPETTVTMPKALTANTGLDALTHAIEAYVSKDASPMTDLHALEAIRLVGAHLATAVENGGDLTARGAMMLGSMLAGLSFSNAILGAVHSMAHSLGGHADLPHGLCNAILLDIVVAFNFDSAPERYRDVALALGEDMGGCGLGDECRDKVLAAIRRLKSEVGADKHLAALGVSPKDLDKLARLALADPCLATNPRKPSLEDIRDMFAQAM